MKFIEEAFKEIFPDKDLPEINLKYSGKFSAYNANVKHSFNKLDFALSKNWRSVDNSIKKGLIQALMLKIYRRKYVNLPKSTVYIDLYNNFTKNLHIAIPKTESHPVLEDSFNRINEIYFMGLLEIPNLVWGEYSKRTLGTYNYQTDTIKISRYFEDSPIELLDSVMHHEMLHKKLQFKCSSGKTFHHSSEFKRLEREFENYDAVQKQISSYIRYKRIAQRSRNAGSFSLKRWLFG